jgi:hypothetical protein
MVREGSDISVLLPILDANEGSFFHNTYIGEEITFSAQQ